MHTVSPIQQGKRLRKANPTLGPLEHGFEGQLSNPHSARNLRNHTEPQAAKFKLSPSSGAPAKDSGEVGAVAARKGSKHSSLAGIVY